MVDTTIQKKLKNDILKRRSIKNEIERYVRAVSQWKDKLAKLKSFQEQTKYTASIKRYVSKIEGLRAGLNRMNEEVDKHIREVGKFSDSEVKKFSSQLEQEIGDIETGEESNKEKVSKKDIEEIKNARKKLAELKGKGNLQQKIEKAREKVNEDLEEIERTTGKIITLNRHLKKVDEETGSTSGDQDELLYTQELKRIVREKAIYG